MIGFISAYAASQMAHTLPFVRLSFDLTEGQMSLMFAGVRAASLLGVLFAVVADRTGRRKPLLAGFRPDGPGFSVDRLHPDGGRIRR